MVSRYDGRTSVPSDVLTDGDDRWHPRKPAAGGGTRGGVAASGNPHREPPQKEERPGHFCHLLAIPLLFPSFHLLPPLAALLGSNTSTSCQQPSTASPKSSQQQTSELAQRQHHHPYQPLGFRHWPLVVYSAIRLGISSPPVPIFCVFSRRDPSRAHAIPTHGSSTLDRHHARLHPSRIIGNLTSRLCILGRISGSRFFQPIAALSFHKPARPP